MTVRAAVWKINHEVMESMLRMWFQQTRSVGDATDLRLLDVSIDGGFIVALVELTRAGFVYEPKVQETIDSIVNEA